MPKKTKVPSGLLSKPKKILLFPQMEICRKIFLLRCLYSETSFLLVEILISHLYCDVTAGQPVPKQYFFMIPSAWKDTTKRCLSKLALMWRGFFPATLILVDILCVCMAGCLGELQWKGGQCYHSKHVMPCGDRKPHLGHSGLVVSPGVSPHISLGVSPHNSWGLVPFLCRKQTCRCYFGNVPDKPFHSQPYHFCNVTW